jgi:uncharacterized membrane protein
MVDSCLAHISLERDHPHAVLIRPLIVAGVWVVGALFAVAALLGHGWWEMPAVLVLVLAALGTWDGLQTRHTILRLYPILGHVRFLAEFIRPEIRHRDGGRRGAGWPPVRCTGGIVGDASRHNATRSGIDAVPAGIGAQVLGRLGDDRRRELRARGAAMGVDEAVAFALANIDPKLLAGPITFD